MATIDAIINANLAAADESRAAMLEAVQAISIPKHLVGFSTIGVDTTLFNAQYQAAPPDTTPYPIFNTPTQAAPVSPTLVALHGIDTPVMPISPTLNLSGLFQQQIPNDALPQFQGQAPILHGQEIYNAMVALPFPVLTDVDIPKLQAIALRATPKVTLPGYTPPVVTADLADPIDYVQNFKTNYLADKAEVNGFVNDMMDLFINKYAPEYPDMAANLSAAVQRGLSGELLPNKLEESLYSRHQARISNEMDKAEQAIVDNPAYRGFIVPPGKQQAALDNLAVDSAITLAGASTDVYNTLQTALVQSYQFMLTMANGIVTSVRGQILQFAGTALQILESARQKAKIETDYAVQRFEQLKAKAELSIALGRYLNEAAKTALEQAMADLEVYKVELEAAKLTADIDQTRIDGARLQLDAQKVKVSLYSEIVDAIAKRAVGDDIAVKQFGLLVQLFETQVKGVLARYDVVEASIKGDTAKVQGELAKVDVYLGQLKGVTAQVEAQKAVQQGDIQTNQANLEAFKYKQEAFNLAWDIALKRFTADASIKELGQKTFQLQSNVNLSVFESQLKQNIAQQEAIIQAFRGNIESISHFFDLQKAYTELGFRAQTVIAQGLGEVAASYGQANSGVVSLAGTA